MLQGGLALLLLSLGHVQLSNTSWIFNTKQLNAVPTVDIVIPEQGLNIMTDKNCLFSMGNFNTSKSNHDHWYLETFVFAITTQSRSSAN